MRVTIIGGGVAGLQTAIALKRLGVEPVIIEKSDALGGKLRGWHKLFPTMTPTAEVLSPLLREVADTEVEVYVSTEVFAIEVDGVLTSHGKIESRATVVCSGFDLFDATLKEEYGYGIYDNVITSAELERMMKDDKVVLADGTVPKRIAFLHCVGSRDEKVQQRHCSKVCCVTGVKQAIEMRLMFPQSEVYNFYMDIRMFGSGYEEMYRSAQQDYGVQFIRGRISEAAPVFDGKVQIKAEDTLIGRPLKMTVDLLVLLVGMTAGRSNVCWSQCRGVELCDSGFVKPLNNFDGNVCSALPNVFYAGTVTAPKTIGETLNEANAVALCVAKYLGLL
jgi:heterodisulfide reductase subunit A